MDPFGRFFVAQDEDSIDCALLAMQNLLQRKDIYREQLNAAAKVIAKLTGDDVLNHTANGFWSIDTVMYTLTCMGYNSEYSNDTDFSNSDIIGYIVHMPDKHHFACVRRHYKEPTWVEIVDSMEGIQSVPLEKFAEQSKNDRWNLTRVFTKK